MISMIIGRQQLSTICDNSFSGTVNEHCAQNRVLYSQLRNSFMFDELWSEIQDAPGEIFDIEDFKVDVKDPCTIALEHDAKLLELLNAN